jgi:4-amino-4-deoxy-L-arabinose transferase-like glycosyltransferase
MGEDGGPAVGVVAPARAEPAPSPGVARRPVPGRIVEHPTVQFVLVVILAFVPRVASAGHFYTTDEVLWMARSDRFFHAITTLDVANASSTVNGRGTMPGITTVWVGSAARALWSVLGHLGVSDSRKLPFQASPLGFTIAQVLSALVSALIIGALWWVLVRWASKTVAVVAVVLLATEPFLVGHGAVLHTDSFVALFGALGTFALLAVLDVPRRATVLEGRERTIMAVLAGIGLAGSVLTKLNALSFGPFALVVVVIAGVRAWRGGRQRQLLVTLGIVLAAAVVLVLVMWPAIWADPSGQVRVMSRSLSAQVDSGNTQFFRGDIVAAGPFYYYAVAVPLRMTPWFLVLSVLAVVGTLIAPETRARAITVLGFMAVPWLVISGAGQKFDRYGTVVWPGLAVLVGLLVAVVISHVPVHRRTRMLALAGAALVALLLVNTLVIAPYNISYFNPLLGGSAQGEKTLLVGWGEGLEQAGAIIERDQGGCTHHRVAVNYAIKAAFVCERPIPIQFVGRLHKGDYIVIYVNYAQRTAPSILRVLRQSGKRIGEVHIRGIRYAEVIKVERPFGPQ